MLQPVDGKTDNLAKSASIKDDFSQAILLTQQRIEPVLERLLVLPPQRFTNLLETMHYAVLGGGKRIRAALIYALEAPLSVASIASDQIAAAVEMMHASSLIHDDLPALDNDDLRRGKPACHIAHGEALAILAGDALISHGFQALFDIAKLGDLAAEKILRLAEVLQVAIGPEGMMAGQAMEFSFDKHPLSVDEVEELYRLKTGALLASGLKMMVIASPLQVDHLVEPFSKLGFHLGLAFQLRDDLLEQTQDEATLGKSNQSDINNQRQTLVQLLGQQQAAEKLQFHCQQVHQILQKTGLNFDRLHRVVDYIIERTF